MEGSLLDRLPSFLKSDNAKLTLCAISASLITASTILTLQATSRHHQSLISRQQALENASLPHRTVHLNQSGGQQTETEPLIPPSTATNNNHNDTNRPPRREYDEDLIREQLSRNYLFFTPTGMSRIRDAFVVVVGVGGVGSWAATMLVRSGITKLRIIDFDQVTLSSLNRHAVADLEDVGTPKVVALAKHLRRVAPWVKIDARVELFEQAHADTLLSPWSLDEADDAAEAAEGGKGQSRESAPDFVIDAIDNIVTKSDLLAYCHTHSIKCIASMGAGCKSDPTRIHLSDISETSEDPLSRATRRHLRLRGIRNGIPVVYSTEKPAPGKATLPDFDASGDLLNKEDIDAYAILPDFRARIMPVLGSMPAIFGLTCATFVLTTLAGYPTSPVPVKPTRQATSVSILQSLHTPTNHQKEQTSGEKAAGKEEGKEGEGERKRKVGVSVSDVQFLIDECQSQKSMLPPFTPSHHASPLTLTLLDPKGLMQLDNLIVVTKEEARLHERKWDGGGYSQAELDALMKGVEKCKALQKWREG